MGIFSSTSAAICSVMDTATDVAGAAGKSVSMVTTYVDNRAVSQRLTDTQQVLLETSKVMKGIKAELDADADLAAQYNALKAEFGL